MGWTIEFTDDAARQLGKLDHAEARRIREYLRKRVAMLENPRLVGHALKGSEYGHLWRYRAGDYRILCELRDRTLLILVVDVGHHSEIYR